MRMEEEEAKVRETAAAATAGTEEKTGAETGDREGGKAEAGRMEGRAAMTEVAVTEAWTAARTAGAGAATATIGSAEKKMTRTLCWEATPCRPEQSRRARRMPCFAPVAVLLRAEIETRYSFFLLTIKLFVELVLVVRDFFGTVV